MVEINSQITITILVVAMVIIILVWRFSSGPYGKLQPSGEETEAYESFQVNPRLNYYLSGPELYPHALMGIDKDWTLESDLWKKKDLAPEGMGELVRGMETKARDNLVRLQGFAILDHKDMKIGNYFSLPGVHVLVRIKGEKRVEISTPPIDVYDVK